MSVPATSAGLAGAIKAVAGAAGAAGSAAWLWSMDPDHAKAMIAAVGMAFMGLLYFGLKDLVPVFIAARKQLKQMSLDLAAMDRTVQTSQVDIAAIQSEAARAKALAEDATEVVHRKEAQLDMLQEQLDKATHKRHDIRDEMDRIELRARLEKGEMQARIAHLEAQLGLTGATHAVAINATAENVEALADKTHTVLPAPTPHVEPTGSADDLLAHQPPR